MASDYKRRWAKSKCGYDSAQDSDIRKYIYEENDYSKNGAIAMFKLNYMSENYKRKRFDGSQLDLFKKRT